jgi:hypothetical protein
VAQDVFRVIVRKLLGPVIVPFALVIAPVIDATIILFVGIVVGSYFSSALDHILMAKGTTIMTAFSGGIDFDTFSVIV